MEEWEEKFIKKAKDANPDCCARCPCIDFKYGGIGDCMITDETMDNLCETRGEKCPLKDVQMS